MGTRTFPMVGRNDACSPSVPGLIWCSENCEGGVLGESERGERDLKVRSDQTQQSVRVSYDSVVF